MANEDVNSARQYIEKAEGWAEPTDPIASALIGIGYGLLALVEALEAEPPPAPNDAAGQ